MLPKVLGIVSARSLKIFVVYLVVVLILYRMLSFGKKFDGLDELKLEIRMVQHIQSKLMARNEELLRKYLALRQRNSQMRIQLKEKQRRPTLPYEKARRRIFKSIEPFWDFLQFRLLEMKTVTDPKGLTEQIDALLQSSRDYKIFLSGNMEMLSRSDGHDLWRLEESKTLRNAIAQRLLSLQNPSNCDSAPILKCYPYVNPQGWGSTIHHIAECMTVAYATDRTMVFNSTGLHYSPAEGFKHLLRPFSRTCLRTPHNVHEPLWPGDNLSQIVALDREILREAFPTSMRVPKNLFERLELLTDEPLAWWIGQLWNLTVAYTDEIQAMIKARGSLKKPIVGVHVRRTDKLKPHRGPNPIEAYMKRVDEYFDRLELINGRSVGKRRVFLATEDPDAIREAIAKFPHYEIVSNVSAASVAKSLDKRWTKSSLLDMIVDLQLLRSTDFVVCTYSSNVCLLLLEHFQVQFPDTTSKLVSLDSMYFTDFRLNRLGRALHRHVPVYERELSLEIGDEFHIYRYKNGNGLYFGFNMRTRRRGFVPVYKIELVVQTFEVQPFFGH